MRGSNPTLTQPYPAHPLTSPPLQPGTQPQPWRGPLSSLSPAPITLTPDCPPPPHLCGPPALRSPPMSEGQLKSLTAPSPASGPVRAAS